MKNRTMLLALIAALAIAPLAKAADVAPAKAPPATNWSLGAYPLYNGLIVGIYTEGGGGSVSASAPGIPPASLTTTTAAVGLTLGYMWTPHNSPVSFSFEADACAQNFNGNSAGFSMTGPLCFEQRVMAFAPWQKLLAALPSIPNPFSNISAFSFQPGVSAVGPSLAGVGFGFYERDISTAFLGVQAGKVWRAEPELVFMNVQPLSNGTALRGGLKIGFPDKGRIFGSAPSGVTSAVLGTPDVRAFIGAAF